MSADTTPSPAGAPLAGICIVSLALNLPGPAALMRLRSMGATCHKVEPSAESETGGDLLAAFAPAVHATLHEGVTLHHLDLKREEGRTALDALLSTADVLLTSFRPAALHRLGLDAEAVLDRFPELAVVSVVGESGAAADHPGHDVTYQAAAGLIPGAELPVSLLADMAGALLTTEATLRALRRRAITPAARIVEEVSLLDAARFLALPRTWGLIAPTAPLGGGHAGYAIYPCQGGRVAVAALEPRLAMALCRAVGLPDADASGMHTARVRSALRDYFAAHTAAELQHAAMSGQVSWYVMIDGAS